MEHMLSRIEIAASPVRRKRFMGPIEIAKDTAALAVAVVGRERVRVGTIAFVTRTLAAAGAVHVHFVGYEILPDCKHRLPIASIASRADIFGDSIEEKCRRTAWPSIVRCSLIGI